MCPFCLATLGLYVAGSLSTGGLAALAVKMFRNDSTSGSITNPNQRSIPDVNHD